MKTIYVFRGGRMERQGNTLLFSGQKKTYLPITTVGEILVFGEVDMNKKALEFLAQNHILVHFFNYYGYYVGSFVPRAHNASGHVILKQVEHYMDIKKRMIIAQRVVSGAIANMQMVLKYYGGRGTDVKEEIAALDSMGQRVALTADVQELMGMEGNARELYYISFNKILNNPDFMFAGRTRRPPKSPLDALLSFGNSLLYVTTLSEIFKTHIDPRIGFLHSTNFRRYTLNLDLSELFKPIIVDRIIFTLINRHVFTKSNFVEELGGTYLSDEGRKRFTEEYERRLHVTIMHSTLGQISYRRVIRDEVLKLEKHLIGDQEYVPFKSGW